MNKNTILQKWTEDSEVKYHRSHFVIFSILRTVEDILFIKKIPFFGCTGPQLWHPDLCPSLRHATALTRGGPWAPCSGSAEPQPLDHQRSPGNTCSLRGNSLYFGEGNGNPFQYSCLANPMDRGAWQAAVHGVARSWTRLSNFTFPFHFHALEKEMAATSVFLPGKFYGQRSLVGYSPQGCKELNTIQQLITHAQHHLGSSLYTDDQKAAAQNLSSQTAVNFLC